MSVLSLFAGIGGLELGLERAGMRVVGQVEIEPFNRETLVRRWSSVWRHDDVRTLTREMVEANAGRVDVVCGGFPCQDISSAGKGAGIDGKRSGLWKEMHRVIELVRPRWVVAENVPALRTRGADRVLGDLEGIGYACWAIVVGADDVLAPHRRKRVFILARLADAQRDGGRREVPRGGPGGRAAPAGAVEHLAHGDGDGREGVGGRSEDEQRHAGRCVRSFEAFPPPPDVDFDAVSKALSRAATLNEARAVGDSAIRARRRIFARWRRVLEADLGIAPATTVEHQIRDVAHGVPGGMDTPRGDRLARRWRKEALKALGNAVVPQVAEVIGAGVMEFERVKREGAGITHKTQKRTNRGETS